VPAYYKEEMKEGKVVRVQDIAFITYVAHITPVPLSDLPISPVSKRFSFTYTRVISSLRPSDRNSAAKPGLLKLSLSPQTTYPDLPQSPSTALPIRYTPLRLIVRPFHLTVGA
jgi:hypothetical protein